MTDQARNTDNLGSGTKYDTYKTRMDLLPVESLTEVAKVLAMGAGKYGDYNWARGIKYSRVLAAILRHLFSYISGEDKDPESGLSHLAHAACGLLFLLHYEKYRAEYDDRSKEAYTKKGTDHVD